MKSINPSGSRKSSKPTPTPLNQGQFQKTIDHFRAALHLEPGVAEIHESLGRALALQGKPDEAAAHREEAVRILKTSPSAP
jgi:tetratricopeptide (TPR) repeat protein